MGSSDVLSGVFCRGVSQGKGQRRGFLCRRMRTFSWSCVMIRDLQWTDRGLATSREHGDFGGRNFGGLEM